MQPRTTDPAAEGPHGVMPAAPDGGLWRNDAFRRLWIAATISVFGSLITRMALPFVAILVLDAGPFEVALVRSIDLAAVLLVGLVVGAWVDRLRRRPVMIWSDLGRALLLLTIPMAALGGWLTLPHLLVVAFLAAILSAFFDAADNAYLPTIVPRAQLVRANGALTATGSAAEFSAFGLSGFLIQLVTAPIAILVDAVTFVVSAVLLATIRRPEPPPPERSTREPVLDEIREGVSILLRDPVLRALALGQMALAALWGVFGAVWILFAVQELRLDAAAVGVIAAVGGLSSLAGAAFAERVTRRVGVGRAAVTALLLAALGNALIPLAPAGAPLVAFALLVAQQLIADGAVTLFDVTEVSVRQVRVDDRALGRVAATVHVGSVGVQLAAALVAGVLAEVIGLRLTAFAAPLGALVAAALVFGSPVRRLGALDTIPASRSA